MRLFALLPLALALLLVLACGFEEQQLHDGVWHGSCECGERGVACSGVKGWMDRSCVTFRCQMYPSVSQHIHDALHREVFGQDEAISRVINDMTLHLDAVARDHATSPLVMHFAGDNGVGKSKTASVIVETAFKMHQGLPHERQYATLALQGSYYKAYYGDSGEFDKTAHRKSVRDQSKELRERIARQLRKCRNSFIIINDLEKMDADVFKSLEEFFTGSVTIEDHNRHVTISTTHATFILTSDFSRADTTRDMTIDQVELLVRDTFQSYVGERAARLASLITHVPFASLDKERIEDIVDASIGSLFTCGDVWKCVRWTPQVTQLLAHEWNSDAAVRGMNGRAVKQRLLPRHIQPAVSAAEHIVRSSGGGQHTLVLDVEEDDAGPHVTAHAEPLNQPGSQLQWSLGLLSSSPYSPFPSQSTSKSQPRRGWRWRERVEL